MKTIRTGIGYGLMALIISTISLFALEYLGYSDKLNVPNLDITFIITAVFIAPLLEEFIYRFVPIKLTRRFTDSKSVLWIVIILSSIIFGLRHGSPYNILVQGIGGFILSLAFLKRGYWCSVTAHTTLNSIAILLAILGF